MTTMTGSAYVEPRSIGNYGSWLAPRETPASVVTMIGNLRSAVGRNLDLFAIVAGPQQPGEFIGETGVSVDSFLLQATQASGGEIIPQLNLNYYTSGTGVTSQSYCDPKNPKNCGPSWFFEVSSELLALQAVSKESNKTVYLEAWDQFNRDLITLGYSSGKACSVIQQLHAQGWNTFLVKQIGPAYFSDCGLASGQAATFVTSSSSPYLLPNTAILSQMPSAEYHLEFFDRQALSKTTALCYYLKDLSPSQQQLALTSLAQHQSGDSYNFVYPLLTYVTCGTTQYTWDASTNKMANGQPFITLISSLLRSN